MGLLYPTGKTHRRRGTTVEALYMFTERADKGVDSRSATSGPMHLRSIRDGELKGGRRDVRLLEIGSWLCSLSFFVRDIEAQANKFSFFGVDRCLLVRKGTGWWLTPYGD